MKQAEMEARRNLVDTGRQCPSSVIMSALWHAMVNQLFCVYVVGWFSCTISRSVAQKVFLAAFTVKFVCPVASIQLCCGGLYI